MHDIRQGIRRRVRPSGSVRSPVQMSLGMLMLGAGIACLFFATVGSGQRPAPPRATVTVTARDLSAAADVPRLIPTPVNPPTPKASSSSAASSASSARTTEPKATRPKGPEPKATEDRARPAATGKPKSSKVTAAAGTTGDPVNVAAAGVVRVSSKVQDYVGGHVTDGDPNTYWEAEPGFPQTVTVDLGRVRSLARLELSLPPVSSWNQRTQTIAVDGSRNGQAYAQVAPAASYAFDARAATDDRVTVAVPGTRARYLRLTFTANDGWPAAQLSELRAYAS